MNQNGAVASSGLVCTNDGFTTMIQEGTEVLFGALAIVKEIGIGMVPDNFKNAINYGWTGAMGMGNWVGYVMASMYYLAEEGGFGADICEFFGYGYYVIDELHKLVDFMPKPEEGSGGGGMSAFLNIASNAALTDAMNASLGGFLDAQATSEAEAKAELQA